MSGAASVFADLLIRLHLGAGSNLFLQPLFKGALLSDFTGSLDASNESGCVVAFGVSEVAEIQGRLDSGVCRSQVDAAARSRSGDVGSHAECITVPDCTITQTLGVEGKGNLVAVHHDVGSVSVVACGVGWLSANEDTSIRIHGGLIGGNRLVELPHDDGLWVVKQVFANSRDILDNGNSQVLQLRARAKTRVKHQTGRVNSASAKDDFLSGLEHHLLATCQMKGNAARNIVFHQDFGDVSLGQDSQIWPSLFASKDGVDVSNGCAASSAVIRVVGNVEKAGALG